MHKSTPAKLKKTANSSTLPHPSKIRKTRKVAPTVRSRRHMTSTPNPAAPKSLPHDAAKGTPIFDVADTLFDLDHYMSLAESVEADLPTYTPQTIEKILLSSIVKNTVALATKKCCSLCVLPKEEIRRMNTKYADTFHYVEIDLEDLQNADDFRGKYKYHIPVVLINGKMFSKGNFEGKQADFDAAIANLAALQSNGVSGPSLLPMPAFKPELAAASV